jgi:hypothetical protein
MSMFEIYFDLQLYIDLFVCQLKYLKSIVSFVDRLKADIYEIEDNTELL